MQLIKYTSWEINGKLIKLNITITFYTLAPLLTCAVQFIFTQVTSEKPIIGLNPDSNQSSLIQLHLHYINLSLNEITLVVAYH